MVVSNFFFIPTWGNDPICRAYFSIGLVQPPPSLVCLGYIGDGILRSYNQDSTMDPYKTTRIQWKVRLGFFVIFFTETTCLGSERIGRIQLEEKIDKNAKIDKNGLRLHPVNSRNFETFGCDYRHIRFLYIFFV